MTAIHITDNIEPQAYDSYVAGHPQASFFHQRFFCDILDGVAGHQVTILGAIKNGVLVGVLPLALRRSPLFGRRADSLPFAVYAGPLADSSEIMDQLAEHAWTLSQDFGAKQLVLNCKEAPSGALSDWDVRDGSATFIRALSDSADTRLKDIPRKQRAVVRKAMGAGLQLDYGPQHFEAFYHLYAISVRNLGSPVFSKKLLSAMATEAGENCDITIVRSPNGLPIASLMSFYFRDVVMPYYAGGLPQARSYAAHDLMYFDLMNRAHGRGAIYFDFGRSKKGSGPYQFKKNWGFEPQSLAYRAKVAQGAKADDLSPQNTKFALASAIWRRLPLWATKQLGPSLANHLG